MEDNNNIYTGGGIVPPNNNSDKPYVPKHEKPAEQPQYGGQPRYGSQPQNRQVPPPPTQPSGGRPVYDRFMYEPIGFDEYDRMSAAEIRAEDEKREHKRRTGREKAILILFFVLVFATLALGIFGIAADLIRSDKHITT